MEKRTREIIALALLIALGLGVGGAMVWYIVVGHNWNIAATHIDDYVGEMDGYTVILYEGTTPRATIGAVGALNAARLESVDAIAGGSRSGAPEAGVGSEDSADVSQSGLSQDADAVSMGGSSAGSPSSSSADFGLSGLQTAITADEVAASYREKDAQVIVLDAKEIAKYADPWILKRSGKRIGVFSLEGKYAYADLVSNVAYLKRHKVDKIVALLNDKSLSRARLHGVDVAVFACNAKIGPEGTHVGRTFCVDSPYKGEVQAVILSPSNVLSSKTLDSL